MDRKNLYFVNAPVDAFFMGGLSILVFLYYQFFYRGYSHLQVSDTAMSLAVFFNWIVNYPHFAATSYRFYQSKEHREEFRLTAILIPFLILLGTIACFVWPEKFAPVWTKVYMMWAVYHYSGQNYGLTLIYAKRANIEVHTWWRFVLAGFLYSCFVAQLTAMEALGGTGWVVGMTFPLLQIPLWVSALMRYVSYGFALALFFYAIQWSRRHKRGIPWIVALPVVAQYTWTLLSAQTFSFQILVALFHGLQYLLVAWAMEMHRQAASPSAADSWRFLSSRTLYWAAMILVTGAFIFFGLPWLVSLLGYELTFPLGVFFVSVQIHHFFVDGVIWKLRGEKHRSPLFTNFRAAFAKGGA